MGKIEIHGVKASPPARAVLITCELAGIPYELKTLIPMNKTPEFKKLNPQQQIPVMVDDGFTLPESRAIIKYLLEKYAKDDSLYPKDLKTRALINARLDFDNGTLWPRQVAAFRPTFTGGKLTEEAIQTVKESLAVVEEFLTRNKWIAGPKMTIADISYVAIIALLPFFQFDLTPFPKLRAWIDECNKVEVIKKLNEEGLANFKEILVQFQAAAAAGKTV